VFPKDLIKPCILAGCPKGKTVLDPFAGSGTTGQVAEALGRESILIELNPTYLQMQKSRSAIGAVLNPPTPEVTEEPMAEPGWLF
jgi:DNA modification methylase